MEAQGKIAIFDQKEIKKISSLFFFNFLYLDPHPYPHPDSVKMLSDLDSLYPYSQH